MYLFYYVATFLTRMLLFTLTRLEVSGRERVPKKGPLILVSNHLNNLDPPILAACLSRRVVFMAKEELYYARSISGLLSRGFGAFPVRRGEADRRALKLALQMLESGLVLGLFPEGTRSLNGQLQEAQMGTAWIALHSGAPILPVAIWGTESVRTVGDVLARPSISVRIGEPFSLPALPSGTRSVRLGLATLAIMGTIAGLLPPEYRGAYSDVGAAKWK